MILYYLTHVASPAVLPNLQGLPMKGGMRLEDVECDGCNIYFSKDGGGWKTQNTEVTPPPPFAAPLIGMNGIDLA